MKTFLLLNEKPETFPSCKSTAQTNELKGSTHRGLPKDQTFTTTTQIYWKTNNAEINKKDPRKKRERSNMAAVTHRTAKTSLKLQLQISTSIWCHYRPWCASLCLCMWVFSEHLAVRSHAQICMECLRRFLEDGAFWNKSGSECRGSLVVSGTALTGRRKWSWALTVKPWRWWRDVITIQLPYGALTPSAPTPRPPCTKNRLVFYLKIYKDHAWGEEKFFMKASADICGYLLHKYLHNHER